MKKLKNVVILWMMVYLLITTLFFLLNPWLMLMPLYIRTLILSMIMVFGMQYVILPSLEQLKTNILTKRKNGNTSTIHRHTK